MLKPLNQKMSPPGSHLFWYTQSVERSRKHLLKALLCVGVEPAAVYFWSNRRKPGKYLFGGERALKRPLKETLSVVAVLWTLTY